MLDQLAADPLWAREYDEFVLDKSFAKPTEVISFETAIAAVHQLVDLVLGIKTS